MKFEDVKKLHQKKFREEFGFFLVEGEHLVQELQKAAVHDTRLRTSEIYLTRDYAHWSSPLPMHVIQSKQMAQISETRSPQGIAAVVPLFTTPRRARTNARSTCTRSRTRAISAPSCARWRGSGISVACSVPTVSTSTTARWCARAWAPSFMCRSSSTCRWTRCAAVSSASPAWIWTASRSHRRQFREFDCYVFGNEARGLPQSSGALNAKPFTIAGTGAIESLNVAATVNICLYELNRPG